MNFAPSQGKAVKNDVRTCSATCFRKLRTMDSFFLKLHIALHIENVRPCTSKIDAPLLAVVGTKAIAEHWSEAGEQARLSAGECDRESEIDPWRSPDHTRGCQAADSRFYLMMLPANTNAVVQIRWML